ncbi:hypothetical protein H0H93_000234 [Arthromyces matolae]|nr:hypothetical protein H0H93_000234 [Arthromyces matolae]
MHELQRCHHRCQRESDSIRYRQIPSLATLVFKNVYFIFLLDWPYRSIPLYRVANFELGRRVRVMADAQAEAAELVGFGKIYAPFVIDKPLVQGVVWISLILDTFHFAMVADAIHYWYLTCRQPENYLGLLQFHWSLGASIIATYLITSCVQGTIQKLLSAVHQQMGQVGGSIELAATSLCDIAISISLWYYLHRNRSGFARTETVVKKLILYTVNIGLLTSGASSLTLILWLALPQNFGFISLTLIRSKRECLLRLS